MAMKIHTLLGVGALGTPHIEVNDLVLWFVLSLALLSAFPWVQDDSVCVELVDLWIPGAQHHICEPTHSCTKAHTLRHYMLTR